MKIDETPERWVILEINPPDGTEKFFKVFATWAGGYLGSDRWKINSGIESVTADEDYYYFKGFSGSVYQCHKKAYGVITDVGNVKLNMAIIEAKGRVVLQLNREDWVEFIIN